MTSWRLLRKPRRRARGACRRRRSLRRAVAVAGTASSKVPRTGNATARLASSRCAAPPLRFGPAGDPRQSAANRFAMAVSELPARAGRCCQANAGGELKSYIFWRVGEETRFCCRSPLKSCPCGLQQNRTLHLFKMRTVLFVYNIPASSRLATASAPAHSFQCFERHSLEWRAFDCECGNCLNREGLQQSTLVSFSAFCAPTGSADTCRPPGSCAPPSSRVAQPAKMRKGL